MITVSEDNKIDAQELYDRLIIIIRACDDCRPWEIERQVRGLAKEIFEIGKIE
jgi:hypothetical protein